MWQSLLRLKITESVPDCISSRARQPLGLCCRVWQKVAKWQNRHKKKVAIATKPFLLSGNLGDIM